VGVIDKLGDGVSDFAPRETVAALTMFGGYAQYLCVAAAELTRVPPGVDPAEAVSLVLNYVTAQQMIHRVAGLAAGQSVLIHGAAGGVGTAALELGKLAGLKMYGTASRGKHDLVTALGGIPIDYRSDDFVARVLQMTGGVGVDAAFDAVGGSNWWRSYKTLAPSHTTTLTPPSRLASLTCLFESSGDLPLLIRFTSSGPTQKKGGVFSSRRKSSATKTLTPHPMIRESEPCDSSKTTARKAS
jgi:NADPH:quinone reductase-like Zn-dependent oxidoreductase